MKYETRYKFIVYLLMLQKDGRRSLPTDTIFSYNVYTLLSKYSNNLTINYINLKKNQKQDIS